jgi:hypothetical protein
MIKMFQYFFVFFAIINSINFDVKIPDKLIFTQFFFVWIKYRIFVQNNNTIETN